MAYAGGRIYFGSYDHHVYALNARTGKLFWKASAQQRLGSRGTFYSTPAVAYGRVYIGSTDGKVYSFGATSGKLRWSHGTGDYVYSSPAVWQERVFAGSYDGTMYCFDAATGDVRWTFKAKGAISGSPNVIRDVLYFSTLKGRTYALNPRNGKLLWGFRRGAYAAARLGPAAALPRRLLARLRPRPAPAPVKSPAPMATKTKMDDLPDLDAEREVDLRSYWDRIAAHWWLLLAGLAAGLVIGYLISLGGSQVYKAKAVVYLGQPLSGSGVQVQSQATNPSTVRQIVTSEATIDSVARRVGLKPSQLRGHISTQAVTGAITRLGQNPLVAISVTGHLRGKVARAANGLARTVVFSPALASYSTDQNLEPSDAGPGRAGGAQLPRQEHQGPAGRCGSRLGPLDHRPPDPDEHDQRPRPATPHHRRPADDEPAAAALWPRTSRRRS